MKKLLQYFYEYCFIYKLTVNLDKTKVIIFKKGGHGGKKKSTPFYFGPLIVQYTENYEYLGVHITQSALWGCNKEIYV